MPSLAPGRRGKLAFDALAKEAGMSRDPAPDAMTHADAAGQTPDGTMRGLLAGRPGQRSQGDVAASAAPAARVSARSQARGPKAGQEHPAIA
jgi:hypothetical protein